MMENKVFNKIEIMIETGNLEGIQLDDLKVSSCSVTSNEQSSGPGILEATFNMISANEICLSVSPATALPDPEDISEFRIRLRRPKELKLIRVRDLRFVSSTGEVRMPLNMDLIRSLEKSLVCEQYKTDPTFVRDPNQLARRVLDDYFNDDLEFGIWFCHVQCCMSEKALLKAYQNIVFMINQDELVRLEDPIFSHNNKLVTGRLSLKSIFDLVSDDLFCGDFADFLKNISEIRDLRRVSSDYSDLIYAPFEGERIKVRNLDLVWGVDQEYEYNIRMLYDGRYVMLNVSAGSGEEALHKAKARINTAKEYTLIGIDGPEGSESLLDGPVAYAF